MLFAMYEHRWVLMAISAASVVPVSWLVYAFVFGYPREVVVLQHRILSYYCSFVAYSLCVSFYGSPLYEYLLQYALFVCPVLLSGGSL